MRKTFLLLNCLRSGKAHARATVVLMRAQKLCIIAGPLVMRAVGCGHSIGCLKYGVGLRGMNAKRRTVEMRLREASINSGPDDCSFLVTTSVTRQCTRGLSPCLL